MKVMYAKTDIDPVCSSRFRTEVLGHVGCCKYMHAMVKTQLSYLRGYSDPSIEARPAMRIGVRRIDGEILPEIEFNYRASDLPTEVQNVCPFCGETHTAEEAESNSATVQGE